MKHNFLWLFVFPMLALLLYGCQSLPKKESPAPWQSIATAEDLNSTVVDLSRLPEVLQALAKRNPETADFAAGYPDCLEKSQVIDLEGDYVPGEIPLLLQWDPRWGYAPYGGEDPKDLLGVSGCGPTALSMVVVGLTGNTDWNPKAVANFSVTMGYCTENDGTSWLLMTEGSQSMGLDVREIPLDKDAMKNALSGGEVLIASVGPGDFTEKGHFIVLCGYEEGFEIRDPFSVKNSEIRWSYEQLEPQILGLWAFSPHD